MSEILNTSLCNLHAVLKLKDTTRSNKATAIAKDIFGVTLDTDEKNIGELKIVVVFFV